MDVRIAHPEITALMADEEKTRDELLAEISRLRRRLADLEIPALDRVSAEDSRTLESRHRAVLEDQRLACRWRPDGTLTFVSEAYCRYLGRRAEDLVGCSILSLVAEADRDRVRRHMESLVSPNQVEMIECQVIAASGEARWHIRVDHVRGEEGGHACEIESVARDITPQHDMRTELERSAAIIRAVFEFSTEGIVAVNRAGEIVLANARVEAMFGYAEGELLHQPLELLVPEWIRQGHREHRADYFAQPRMRPMGLGKNLSGRRKDGTELPIEVGLSFVPDAEGGVAMAFITDISERVLHARQARHNEKLTALGTLAAGIAHEINNPIGIILSRIELMIMDAKDSRGSSEALEDLNVLHRQAQRLNRLTEGLLTYGRRRQPDREPVDLATVIKDTLMLAGYQLSHDRIEVSTSIDPELPRVLGDAPALQQVLMNLLLNARDAMPDGGALRIAAAPDPDQPGSIRLTVADTGCGMSPEVLANIAKPFFTTKPHGTGLGLSVTHTIIREHGGAMTATSEPGRGSTFTITLPALTAID